MINKTYELHCDELCPHCDPNNSFCWKLERHIRPYDSCIFGYKRDGEGNIIYKFKVLCS